MKKEELNEILKKHKLWLNGKEGGEQANLCQADLHGVDLCLADLLGADLREADLRGANLRGTDLRGANLRGTDLCQADLCEADLCQADLDFSCLTFSCKSLRANFDDRQLIQIAYHLCRAGLQSKNASEETKNELAKIIDFANKFHRVEECGKIEVKE